MAEATLVLKGDSASILRALGQVEGASRKASTAIVRDFDQVAKGTEQSFNKIATAAQRAFATIAREEARVAQGRLRIEQLTTTIVQAESQKRIKAAQGEAQTRGGMQGEMAKALGRIESLLTQTTEQESRRRVAIARREASELVHVAEGAHSRLDGVLRRQGGGRGGGGGGGGRGRRGDPDEISEAMGFTARMLRSAPGAVLGMLSSAGSAALQMGGDVRARRAEAGHTINSAAFQAGADASSASALRQQLFDYARAHRMDSGELAAALDASQTEFSTLGNSRSTQAERTANMSQFLERARFARNTFQDVGQVTRVSGLLQQAGITGDAQEQTLLALTGMAQRGAIELGGVTREAMAPMQMRMANAVNRLQRANPNATPEQIAHAQQSAVMETMAEMEVGRSLGLSPRQMGNVTANMETRLASNVVQGRMFTNIQNASGMTDAQRRHVSETLFETDAQGHHHLRGDYQSTVGLARGLLAAGVDSTTAQNILAGGGQGNPQSLQANERRITAAMMGSEGDVRSLVEGAGRDFTRADVQRGESIATNEDKAVMIGEREQSDSIVANTTAVQDLTREISAFNAAHPFAGAVAKALPGGQTTEALAAFALNDSPDALRQRRIDASLRIADREGFGALNGLGTDSPEGDRLAQRITEEVERGRAAGIRTVETKHSEKGSAALAQDVDTLRRALESAHLSVSITPHDAAFQSAQIASGGNAPPPEHRR